MEFSKLMLKFASHHFASRLHRVSSALLVVFTENLPASVSKYRDPGHLLLIFDHFGSISSL